MTHAPTVTFSKSDAELRSTIASLSDNELRLLRANCDEEIGINRALSNWPAATHAVIGAVIGGVGNAVAQPIAKKMEWTELSFGKFMKHPASLSVIGLSAAFGIVEKYMIRNDVNVAQTARLIDHEFQRRGVQEHVNYEALVDLPWEHIAKGLKDAPTTQVSNATLEETLAPEPQSQARA